MQGLIEEEWEAAHEADLEVLRDLGTRQQAPVSSVSRRGRLIRARTGAAASRERGTPHQAPTQEPSSRDQAEGGRPAKPQPRTTP
jgi:hypothetical protein